MSASAPVQRQALPPQEQRNVSLVLIGLLPLAWLAREFAAHPAVAIAALLLIGAGIVHGVFDLVMLKRGFDPMLADRADVRGERTQPRPQHPGLWQLGTVARRIGPAAAYLAVFGLMWLLWRMLPAPALITFLALSIWHFAQSDSIWRGRLSRYAQWAWRGVLPLVAPCVAWPAEVGALFAQLAQNRELAELLVAIFAHPVTVTLVLIAIGIDAVGAGTRRAFAALLEAGAIAAWLLIAPPLLGFAVYFTFVHSLRHLHQLGMPRLLALSRQRWLAYGVLLVATIALTWGIRADFGAGLGQLYATHAWIFIVLSCFAVPHALLVDHYLRRSNAD